ncbi:glutathione S-transferase family protein [Pelomonas sp. SE-A7]|uniref:glutathione S-transferase family protein n=1 Tax=Pelomonas sp. SE-A7 TaxID=3054953 RepID=UPI00259D06B3|nr:glutathione S-transferase family protein [Pelomonas sp. SE-A7]MDM4766282.1 glutathione S-transferase family protein [Pelomonas sp. SE-A7]
MNELVLVSHRLCPYVQRAAIVLMEKGQAFELRDVDLGNKPDWFLRISPLGKTPVLLVEGEALFESAVICEYLDETLVPALHPQDALQRARQRAWMEFASQLLAGIATLYNAPDEAAMEAQLLQLRRRFEQIEAQLAEGGPWFGGQRFGLVDAAFAPALRYFEVVDEFIAADSLWQGLPRLARWRSALAQRPSVQDAVAPQYAEWLRDFLRRRPSALGRRVVMQRRLAATA